MTDVCNTVDRNAVIMAYRLILGREPESEAVVDAALRGYETIPRLRKGFLESPEFTASFAVPVQARTPLEWENESRIDINCGPEQMQQLFGRVAQTWTELGNSEPYWSVLSADKHKRDAFEKHEEHFWETGHRDVARFFAWLNRNDIRIDPGHVCLEYGCGTGRATRALAPRFRKILACDISSAHLELARQHTAGVGEIEFCHIRSTESLDLPASFDVLYSEIVLQHNPPPVIAYILEKLLRALKPNGIAFFQLPTFILGYSFDIDKYISTTNCGAMEMHVLPQRYLFQVVEKCNCQVLEFREDDKTGSADYVSNTVLLRKRS